MRLYVRTRRGIHVGRTSEFRYSKSCPAYASMYRTHSSNLRTQLREKRPHVSDGDGEGASMCDTHILSPSSIARVLA